MTDVREDLRLPSLALLIADDQLEADVREIAWNDSPQIREYLEAADIHDPAPWCAAFCYWSVREAAAAKGEPNPLDVVELPAYVPSYVQAARKHGWLLHADQYDRVASADLFCLWSAARERFAHIGFVKRPPYEGNDFTTIEGNSNADGSREGVAVVSQERALTDGVKFISWSEE